MTGPHIALPIIGLPDNTAQLTRIEAGLEQVKTRLDRMEVAMATEVEQIEELTAKVTELGEDTAEALRILTEERDNLSAEGQAAFDALKAKVAELHTTVGDADQDGNPAPLEP